MTTQKPPRDPSVATQLDGAQAVDAKPAPKATKAKRPKRPWSKPD